MCSHPSQTQLTRPSMGGWLNSLSVPGGSGLQHYYTFGAQCRAWPLGTRGIESDEPFFHSNSESIQHHSQSLQGDGLTPISCMKEPCLGGQVKTSV